MKYKFFSLLPVCLAASGCLAIAPIALGQSLEEVQHLTCVKDAQGLMCKTEERDSEPVRNPGNGLKAGVPESLKVSTIAAPQLITSAQLEFISNVLLGFLYFVLPTGIGLAIYMHDKYSSYRSAMLEKQIEILERLWM